ncbi:hypothetical protein QBC34DRAFT_465823 [Podospora aff. communis PSN243]|uniref:Uncharacterized protein n=1 Tax=Podospora aff. communis PSN243 TaxID=3040156 RepID=A0AAV9GM57_9PEZI|nr:hypothetical protein QBC34DRAFT_465823 [Podospora aff. communis PSN243]
MPSLPKLTHLPTRHPRSCASLSLPLLAFLNDTLPPPPAPTLSVGSGPGLLEAAFIHQYPKRSAAPISFYGIEVSTDPASPPVNRFLPEQSSLVVPGTWAVAREAEEAEGLVFVYPRQPGLIARYLDAGKGVRVVVWIGPRCDEEEMCEPLRRWGVEEEVDEGLVEEGERVVVYRRREGEEG